VRAAANKEGGLQQQQKSPAAVQGIYRAKMKRTGTLYGVSRIFAREDCPINQGTANA
jgi:hypothetical protein